MTSTLRVRELREGRRMKAVELANAAGISAPMLSQVERGLVDPSLETLRQISRVLEVPLFELFTQDREDALMHVVRAGEELTTTSPLGSLTYARKSAVGKELEVLQGTLQPQSESRATLWSHEAEECIVVLSGTLVIKTDREDLELSAGDSCHFNSRVPHRFSNPTDFPTTFTVSVTPPSH